MSTRKLVKDNRERILDLYNAGLTPVEISKEIGLKYFQPIYNLLIKEGVFKRLKNTPNMRTHSLDESFFETIDTQEKAYILGFICADGFVDEHWGRVVVSLNECDIDILETISQRLNSSAPIRRVLKDKKYNHAVASFCSKKLVNDLVSKGIRQGKSKTMTGEVMNHVPKEHAYHFLRGYFDGDGCICYGIKYSSGTKYSINIIGTKAFLEASFSKYLKTNSSLYAYKTCDMYCWRTTKKEHVDEFINLIYKDASIYLKRKYHKCAHLKPRELLEA